jgi:hypothetical protein
MNGKNEDHYNWPAQECTNTSTEPPQIQNKVSNEEWTKDLSSPINEIVQAAGADVEQGPIIIIEFWKNTYQPLAVLFSCNVWLTPSVEVVAGEEHGEQEDDPRVRPQGHK